MRILVVEDEKMIRKGIITALKQINEALDVVEAQNGKAALELIEQQMPDLVITDVRMPVMDGLALTRELKENYPSIWMIILSGYQEFSYAQQALQSGVSDYLIKPVSFEELSQSLKNVESNIKEQQDRKKLHDDNLNIIRNEWLRNTMNTGKILSTEQINEGKQLNLNIQAPFYQVLAMECDPYPSDDKWLLALSEWSPLVWQITDTEVGIVLNKQDRSSDDIFSVLQEMIDSYVNQVDKHMTIGISPTIDHVKELAEAYSKAVAAKERKAHLGKNKIYESRKEDNWQTNVGIIPDDQSHNTIVEHAKQGNQQKMELYLRRQFDTFSKERVELKMVENWSVYLLIKIYMELHIFQENVLYHEMDKLKQADTTLEILRIVLTNIYNIMEDRDKDKQSSVKKIVDQTIRYMKNHFDEEITLDILAKHAFVSTTYLSKIFKQQTGISLVKWLNEFRIKKAKEYIKANQAMPMYLIAEKVGFNDYKYFIRVFKKEIGFTPSEYKNK